MTNWWADATLPQPVSLRHARREYVQAFLHHVQKMRDAGVDTDRLLSNWDTYTSLTEPPVSYSAQSHLDDADRLVLEAEERLTNDKYDDRVLGLLCLAQTHAMIATAQAQVAAAVGVGAL